MSRFSLTWLWFLLAAVLVFAAIGCGFEVFATGMAIGDMMGAPPYITPEGRQLIAQLTRRNNFAVTEVVFSLALASVCLGTGLRIRYKFSYVYAYIAGFLICPAVVVAIPIGVLAYRELFRF